MKFESIMEAQLTRIQETPKYTYNIIVSDNLPQVEGKIIARRPDPTVFQRETEQGEKLREPPDQSEGEFGVLRLLSGSIREPCGGRSCPGTDCGAAHRSYVYVASCP